MWEYHNYIGYKGIDKWKSRINGAKTSVYALNRPLYIGEWGVFPPSKRTNYPYESTTRQMMVYIDTLGVSDCQHSWSLLYGIEHSTGKGWTDAEVRSFEALQKAR